MKYLEHVNFLISYLEKINEDVSYLEPDYFYKYFNSFYEEEEWSNEFLQGVFDDIEDFVLHLPYKIASNREKILNLKDWQSLRSHLKKLYKYREM